VILKLTGGTGSPLLIDTMGLVVWQESGKEVRLSQAGMSESWVIKETIEEITQQIKEGGVCGSSN
jgi:hypothetical protein